MICFTLFFFLFFSVFIKVSVLIKVSNIIVRYSVIVILIIIARPSKFMCINNKIINNDINNDREDAEALKTFLHIRAGVDGVGRAIATVVVAVLFAGPPHAYPKEVDGVQHHGCDGESYSRQLSDHTRHHLDTHKNFTHLETHS